MQPVHIVHTFQKNQEEELRFSVREYKSRLYLDIRLWFQTSGGGEYHPTKKGITLAMEHLSELKKGIEKAEITASELTLQSSPNSVK